MEVIQAGEEEKLGRKARAGSPAELLSYRASISEIHHTALASSHREKDHVRHVSGTDRDHMGPIRCCREASMCCNSTAAASALPTELSPESFSSHRWSLP